MCCRTCSSRLCGCSSAEARFDYQGRRACRARRIGPDLQKRNHPSPPFLNDSDRAGSIEWGHEGVGRHGYRPPRPGWPWHGITQLSCPAGAAVLLGAQHIGLATDVAEAGARCFALIYFLLALVRAVIRGTAGRARRLEVGKAGWQDWLDIQVRIMIPPLPLTPEWLCFCTLDVVCTYLGLCLFQR